MAKFFRIAAFVIAAVIGCCMLQSCSDDKDGISGWYLSDRESVYVEGKYIGDAVYAYNFINSNTVYSYGAILNMYKSGWYETPIKVGSQTWYGDSPKTYTYTAEDNKVIIPMMGKIFTISGNTIVEEGTSTVYTKYK